MDLSNFVKKLELADDFAAPKELRYEHLIVHPLTRSDLDGDLAAVNSSIEIIQKTRGGRWPSGQLQADFDLVDLAWHEREFRDNRSFAYAVYDQSGEYAGCLYLFPMGFRTKLDEEKLQYDVDASWWVTAAAYERGNYPVLFTALQKWLAAEFPFQNPYFSNKVIPA